MLNQKTTKSIIGHFKDSVRHLLSCLPSDWAAMIILQGSLSLLHSAPGGLRLSSHSAPCCSDSSPLCVGSRYGERLRTIGNVFKECAPRWRDKVPQARTFLPVPFVTCGTAAGESDKSDKSGVR